ncbi:hypothetical protein [uncultured Roseobacter sp.]|uniref:hypothetical protein n=1 Tax=uncultured Roseobacter sp. TaxID=114847 RepID=UPI00262FA628|nr:hypothetical protein [uncultured Roseobacter sp.]
MKKQDNDAETEALDAWFDAARAHPPEVPQALMARVLADADVLQPTQDRHDVVRLGLRAWVADLLGGWQGMGGLVAAATAGVWIGWSPPETLPDAGALILGYESAEVMSTTAELTSFGWDLDGD